MKFLSFLTARIDNKRESEREIPGEKRNRGMFFIDMNLSFYAIFRIILWIEWGRRLLIRGKRIWKETSTSPRKDRGFYTNAYASCSLMIIPRGKVLVEINKLSTQTCINQGVFEMKNKLYDKAVKNFTMAIRESREHALPFILRSRCLTL